MKTLMSKNWYLAVVALLCFAPVVFAEQGTMKPQSSAAIANGSTAISTAAVCDDFAEATDIGESWAANLYRSVKSGRIPTRQGSLADLTPESSTVIQLSADLLGLLGLAIVFRRRLLSLIH